MVNNLRTLLLNLPGEAVGTTPGEEFVPLDYRPAELPVELRRAQTALFGTGADRAGKNLQLARLLGYLHASPLAEYVTAEDSRLTYRPDAVSNVFGSLGTTVAVLDDGGDEPVGWQGSATFTAPGRSYGNWLVTTNGTGSYTVSRAGEDPRTGTVVAQANGDAVALPGSRLSLVVAADASGRWRAELLVPPEHNFAGAAQTGDDTVFRPARSDAEAQWYRYWTESPVAALKAGSFALALAARTQDVLNGSYT